MTEGVMELCEDLTEAVKSGKGGMSDVVNISEFLAVTTVRIITNVALGSNLSRKQRHVFSASRDTYFLRT